MCGACGNPQHTWPWLCMAVGVTTNVTGNDSPLSLCHGKRPGYGMAELGGAASWGREGGAVLHQEHTGWGDCTGLNPWEGVRVLRSCAHTWQSKCPRAI